MSERLKTISKNYYDDEILFKDGITGELYLKAGVHRLHYNDHIDPNKLENHINQEEIVYRKQLDNNELLERDWNE